MNADTSTDDRANWTPLAAQAVVRPCGIHGLAPLLAALLILTLTLASSADAFVYWTGGDDKIGRANLDGTGADESFFAAGSSYAVGVAVDAEHVYWANQRGP